MVPTDSQMTSTDGSTIQAMSSFTFTAVLKGGAAGPGGVTALQPSASALNGIHRRTLRISSPAVTRGILGQLQLPDKGPARTIYGESLKVQHDHLGPSRS